MAAIHLKVRAGIAEEKAIGETPTAPTAGRRWMNNMGEELTLGQWLVMCLYAKFRNEGVAEETINERVRKAFLDIIQQWASLMLTDGYGYINPSICGDKIKQEDKMSENKKPRLAEALGVEVGEKFVIDGRNCNPYSVDEEGLIVDRDGGVCYEVVTYLFNHPNCLIREPRWTEQEIKDAKNIIRMFGEYRYPYVIKTMDGLPYLSDNLETLAMYTINLKPEIFPSLKCGETVKITDIIGGNT